MKREDFEQLVSRWLDQPACPELRRRISEAIERCPQLAQVRGEWLRFERALKDNLPHLEGVAWDKLCARIVAVLAQRQGGDAGAAPGAPPADNDRG